MDVMSYIEKGVSPYHVVDETKQWLKKEGFSELRLEEEWHLEKGRGYFVSPYESCLFAFLPGNEQVRIAAAHTDQPMLKIKPNPVLTREGNYVVNVESYGGMILHTWFDRPLSIAGKVVCRGEQPFAPKVHLYDSGEPLAVVPSLAIHMDREVNQKNALNCQIHLLPLCGLFKEEQEKDPLLSYIAADLGVAYEDILDYDLFFYNPEKPRRVGLKEELLVSSRLDNLTSCHAVIKGLLNAEEGSSKVAALFDHEEIGSRSKQGANSDLLVWVLEKCFRAMEEAQMVAKLSKEQLVKQGFLLSLDVAHAYHPNYSDKSDPTTKTRLGQGVVIKVSGSQKYNSDSVTNAMMIGLCEHEQVRYQRQINRSDIAGGSTLGPILSESLPIPGADMGIPILAMHSATETAAYADLDELTKAAEAFFSN